MTRQAMKDRLIINQIEGVRKNNNTLWMHILRLAVMYAPDQAKEALKRIRVNDLKVSELVEQLTEE